MGEEVVGDWLWGREGGIYAILDQHRDLTPPMTKIRSESFTPILVQALSFQPTECLAGVFCTCATG